MGTLLASFEIPMLVNALTGRGLQVDRNRPKRSLPVYVPATKIKRWSSFDVSASVLWIAGKTNWNGCEKKDLDKERVFYWEKQCIQFNTHSRPHFLNKPPCNFDLLNYVQHLKRK